MPPRLSGDYSPRDLTVLAIALALSAGLFARESPLPVILMVIAAGAWYRGILGGVLTIALLWAARLTFNDGKEPVVRPLLEVSAAGLLITGLASAVRSGRSTAEAAAAEVRAMKQRFDLAAKGARLGLWDWDLVNDSFVGSGRIRPLLGPRGGSSDGVPAALAARLHGEDVYRVRNAFDGHLRKGLPFDVEFRLRTPTGRYRWYHALGQAAWDADGTPTRMAGTLGDVNTRKRVEVRLRALVEAMPQIVWTADDTGAIESVNGRWTEYTGLPAEKSLGDDASTAVHPDDRPAVRRAWREALTLGAPLEVELRILRADGSYRWHLVRAEPVRDRSGRVLKWFGTSTDIDDRNRSEQSTRVLAEVGAALAGAANAEEMVGDLARLAVPRLADWCVIDLVVPDGPAKRAAAHSDPRLLAEWRSVEREAAPLGSSRGGTAEVLRTGVPILYPEFDARALDDVSRGRRHRDAVIRWGVRSALSVPLLARGRTLGAVTLAAAESGRRFGPGDVGVAQELARLVALAVDNSRLLREATHARRAAEDADRAKGRFLAMLSHELRTPLTPALLAVSGLLDDADTPAALRPALTAARRGIELEARLVDDLLDVTRVSSGKLQHNPERVDAESVVRQALTSCADLVRDAGLTLDLRLEAPGATIEADPLRIQQVVWNLVKNASRFTPRGGTITVHTRTVPATPGGPNGRPGGRPGLEIGVTDTGVGIEPELLGRIFEAFDQGGTERGRRSGGLGLGLAIARAIAEAHDGALHAASDGEGRGATFTLVLPAKDAGRATPESPPPDIAGSGDWPKRILLVEDDDATRNVLARLLRRRGADVSTAGTVAEAVAAGSASAFDLLISDLGLPDGTGLNVPRLLGLPSDFPSVALTGYGSEEDVRLCHEAGFSAHLIKPVDFAKLEGVVSRLIQGRDLQVRPEAEV